MQPRRRPCACGNPLQYLIWGCRNILVTTEFPPIRPCINGRTASPSLGPPVSPTSSWRPSPGWRTRSPWVQDSYACAAVTCGGQQGRGAKIRGD